MKRFLAVSGLLAAALAALLAGPAAARVDTHAVSDATLREADRPGAFCTLSRCRPRTASSSTAAAFGAVVVAIRWQARRRERSQA